MTKFKTGDRVVCIRSPGSAKTGATAVVDTPAYRESWLNVIWDRTELADNQMDGSYLEDRFKLLEEKVVKRFDSTKPVRTREGRPARILCTDRKGTYPILALILHKDNFEEHWIYSAEGKVAGTTNECVNDLVNVPVTKWINLYKRGPGRFFHKTQAEAIAEAETEPYKGYIKTIEVELD